VRESLSSCGSQTCAGRFVLTILGPNGLEATEVAVTALENRSRTALLVIDVQNGVVVNAYDRDRVIANIQTLVGKARAEDVPVLWVQHSDDELPKDSEAWEYVPELERLDTEPLVHKSYGDSFESTDLEQLLAERSVGRLVVTGAQTEACIRATLHGALVRGYDATLVSDAHTTEDIRKWGFPVGPEQSIAYTNAYWSWAAAPGRKGSVAPTAEVDFSPV
jgi:isochorismate hydrolase